MLEQREHLVTAEFNMAITLEELRKKVVELGGKIVDGKGLDIKRTVYLISNRRLDELKEEKYSFIKWCDTYGFNNDGQKITYEKYNEKLEELKQYDSGLVKVHHLFHIKFILNDIYYSINLNNNPYFDFYYEVLKTNGKNCINFTNTACVLDKNLFDEFYSFEYNHKESANRILDFLTSQNPRDFDPHSKIVSIR